MKSHQSTLPSESIGLDPNKIDERNIEERVYRHLAMKHSKRALAGDTLEQAAIPKGTVDEAHALRRRILELSLAPDIYANRNLKIKGSHRLG